MIRHLLILHKSGVPLYTKTYSGDTMCCTKKEREDVKVIENDALFSGLVTSLSLMAKELGTELKRINMSKWDVYIKNSEQLMGVLLTEPNTEERNYTDKVNNMVDLFSNTYDFDKWKGNVSQFSDFDYHLHKHGIIHPNHEDMNVCSTCSTGFLNFVNNKLAKVHVKL